jgi:(R,R)-butanediol dehydrogenase/meso-butanediol dehydrogenase/diacetyl reductase
MEKKTMKAAVFLGKREFEIQEIPIPEPGDGEVLIKVEYSAICGSDLHSFTKGLHVMPGQIMGHEFAGTVVAIGPNYPDETLKIGQRVTTNPTVPCGVCRMCRRGLTNICKNAITATLAYGRPGAFAQYVIQGKGGVMYRIPDNVSTKAGALVEPLSVAIHAVKRAKHCMNDKVVVFGAGTIGSMVGQLIKRIGAVEVIQVDMSQLRLDVAKNGGVDHIINARETQDVVAEIAKITGAGDYGPDGAAANTVYECAGVQATLSQAVKAIVHGGEIVCVAAPEDELFINVTALVQKEVSLLASYAYTTEFEEAIDLLANDTIDVDSLISHVYPLEQITEAFEKQLDASSSVKVVLKCFE